MSLMIVSQYSHGLDWWGLMLAKGIVWFSR